MKTKAFAHFCIFWLVLSSALAQQSTNPLVTDKTTTSEGYTFSVSDPALLNESLKINFGTDSPCSKATEAIQARLSLFVLKGGNWQTSSVSEWGGSTVMTDFINMKSGVKMTVSDGNGSHALVVDNLSEIGGYCQSSGRFRQVLLLGSDMTDMLLTPAGREFLTAYVRLTPKTAEWITPTNPRQQGNAVMYWPGIGASTTATYTFFQKKATGMVSQSSRPNKGKYCEGWVTTDLPIGGVVDGSGAVMVVVKEPSGLSVGKLVLMPYELPISNQICK